MTEILYHGLITPTGKIVIKQEGDNKLSFLPLRLDLFNHSPTGFQWGYWGSGPAQLALALLADALEDDEAALHLHQSFKVKVTGQLSQSEPWTMSQQDIIDQTVELMRTAMVPSNH